MFFFRRNHKQASKTRRAPRKTTQRTLRLERLDDRMVLSASPLMLGTTAPGRSVSVNPEAALVGAVQTGVPANVARGAMPLATGNAQRGAGLNVGPTMNGANAATGLNGGTTTGAKNFYNNGEPNGGSGGGEQKTGGETGEKKKDDGAGEAKKDGGATEAKKEKPADFDRMSRSTRERYEDLQRSLTQAIKDRDTGEIARIEREMREILKAAKEANKDEPNGGPGAGEQKSGGDTGEQKKDDGAGEKVKGDGAGEKVQDGGTDEKKPDGGAGEKVKDGGAGEKKKDDGAGEKKKDDGGGEKKEGDGAEEKKNDSGDATRTDDDSKYGLTTGTEKLIDEIRHNMKVNLAYGDQAAFDANVKKLLELLEQAKKDRAAEKGGKK